MKGKEMFFQLASIETKLRLVLEELKKLGLNYKLLEVDYWPDHNCPFSIRLWDGKSSVRFQYPDRGNGTLKEFMTWFERKRILFEKFDRIKEVIR